MNSSFPQQHQQAVIAGLRHRPTSGGSTSRYTRLPSVAVTPSCGESGGNSGSNMTPSPSSSPGPNRPQLRRGSAVEIGDGEDCSAGRIRLMNPQKSQPPPDLKIDLLSESSGTSSPFSRAASLSPCASNEMQSGKNRIEFRLTNRDDYFKSLLTTFEASVTF